MSTPHSAAIVITGAIPTHVTRSFESRDVRAVRWGAVVALLMAVFGLVARLQILTSGMARPRDGNIFFRLYALFESPFLVLTVGAAVVTMAALARRRPSDAANPRWLERLTLHDRVAVRILAAAVLAATLLTTYFVLHEYAFSMDEFSADFQARIFAHGNTTAPLSRFWRPFTPALIPIFVAYSPTTAAWFSGYLPVYALLKSPFVAVGWGGVLNPLFAALSILTIAGVARRLWPKERMRPWLAIAFLATSSQFIITSGTAYSMPAHLFFNLLWLLLYLREDNASFAAALGVGALALGLHNPFPHALFVAPFLIRLMRDRRWGRLMSAAAVYGSASILWYSWLRQGHALTFGAASGGLLDVFGMPNGKTLWLHAINWSLLFTWHTPLFGILVVAALVRAGRLDTRLRDLAAGVLITLGFYLFFPLTQGHGWGYRYAYQVIGSLALLAAAGAAPLRDALGSVLTFRLLAASFVVTLLIQLPLRVAETERFVRPFAAGEEYLRTRAADVVLVHADSVWYGRDLVRNDPFLRGQPAIVRADFLGPLGRSALERVYPGRVIEVSDTELLQLGMTPWTNHSE